MIIYLIKNLKKIRIEPNKLEIKCIRFVEVKLGLTSPFSHLTFE